VNSSFIRVISISPLLNDEVNAFLVLLLFVTQLSAKQSPIIHMMMKNTFYLLLVLFVGLINSQAFSQEQPYNYKAEVKYKLTWQSDSTDKSSVKSEFMTLLIGDTQS